MKLVPAEFMDELIKLMVETGAEEAISQYGLYLEDWANDKGYLCNFEPFENEHGLSHVEVRRWWGEYPRLKTELVGVLYNRPWTSKSMRNDKVFVATALWKRGVNNG